MSVRISKIGFSKARTSRTLSLDGKELVQTVVLSFKLAHECVSSNLKRVLNFLYELVCRARISLSLSLLLVQKTLIDPTLGLSKLEYLSESIWSGVGVDNSKNRGHFFKIAKFKI